MRDIFVVTGMLRRVGLTYFLRKELNPTCELILVGVVGGRD